MSNKCLICTKPTENDTEFHARCSKSFYGVFPPPSLEFTLEKIQDFAAQSVLARVTVTGVQKKLSLGIEETGKDTRLTVVGLWGNFILKPPAEEYCALPENEDTIMRLASIVKIPVVPHAMTRLASGELAYITRRIDRDDGEQKIAMEDFCQISGRLTEDKYKGSVERVGKLLRQYSIYPGLDAVDLFERVVFNYLIGNSDMHLKNYSLIETQLGMHLAPAYDLVSTVLIIPQDNEETALTINGKKSKLNGSDFFSLAEILGISHTVCHKTYKKFQRAESEMYRIIDIGRLPLDMKTALKVLIKSRMGLFTDDK
jgi:serine/threonine-protein kinase HipA